MHEYFEVSQETLIGLLDYSDLSISKKDKDHYFNTEYTLFNYISERVPVETLAPEVIKKLNYLKETSKYKDMNISYLVVIEGMASRDNYYDNDGLSYRRALSLYYLWKKNGISFEQSQCEVQISGSGIRGIRPYNTDYYNAVRLGDSDADSKFNLQDEKKNQCIIIQIIPKISSI